MRSWIISSISLDGLKAESFELLPDNFDPPVEIRRPILAGGKKTPLADLLSLGGGAPAVKGHRLYERRSFSNTNKTATYVEVDPSAVRTIVESETFRKNNGAGGPSRERIRRKGE